MSEFEYQVKWLTMCHLDREIKLNNILQDEEVREAISLLLGSEED